MAVPEVPGMTVMVAVTHMAVPNVGVANMNMTYMGVPNVRVTAVPTAMATAMPTAMPTAAATTVRPCKGGTCAADQHRCGEERSD